MRIHLITIGNKMPHWVNQGFEEYAKRLPNECRLQLIELPSALRTKNTDLTRAINDEGKRLLKATPKNTQIIALDVTGKQHSTETLSTTLSQWLNCGQDITLLIGGADGLSEECLSIAQSKWSLSNLTFPHPLVRVILSEQIYRAWSLLNKHPYHRA